MSELLGEARVVIRPDTTKFRVLLEAELAAATRRPVTIPVIPAVAPSGAGLQVTAIATEALLASQVALQKSITGLIGSLKTLNTTLTATAGATSSTAAAQTAGVTAARRAARANVEYSESMRAVRQGAIAQTAALAGLRGSVIGANSAFIAGIGSVLLFGRAVQSAAQLQTELNVFRVTVGATADQMERVGETAKALGRDLTLPGVTASDAAQTFLQLARAGLSVQESLDGARGVLQLAVAAELSFADAAQITASALNAFALEGEEAVNVADLLTNAANASQASIGDMGIALRQSAAIADLAGFSLSETVTFLTQLARAGLQGSDAGTSFRVSLQRLIAPTAAARKQLQGLNVNLRDAAGNLRPEAFFELGDALERMGRAQADAARQTIFGNDASRAAAFFARINAQAFREQEDALKKQGAAAEVAGAKNEGFSGSVENLKNQVTALGIEIGDLALPVLGALADAAALSFGFLADTVANNRKFLSDLSDSLAEDIEKLEEFADAATVGGSDLRSFLADVEQGAAVFKRASDAVDDYLGGLLGLKGGADAADPPVRKLRQTENELAVEVTEANRRLSAQAFAMDEVADAADTAASAVSRLAGQQKGLAEQITRARIAGDEGAELERLRALRESLEKELAAQEAIIQRPGTAGEATAREAIRNRILPQLETTNNEIENIIKGQKIENENLARDAASAAADAARARDEVDRALIEALGTRRGDQENRAAILAAAGNAQGAIRALDILQQIIKNQIARIKKSVQDEKLKAAAIRELRIAKNQSFREEEALRAQILAERQDQVDQVQQLNIDIAVEKGNEGAIARAINARIATLNKQIAAAKGEQVKVKQLILERERLKNQLKDLKKQGEETGNGKSAREEAAEFLFSQLQAQQGFAANLLGNLIPASQTAGLVGVPAPSGPSGGINIAASVQEGKARGGPTSGQASTTNALLERILEQLKTLNGANATPEATRQRRVGGGAMDNTVM